MLFDNKEELAEKMVRTQINSRGICNERICEVMKQIPRHLFVSGTAKQRAYGDYPVSIGHGQTISQPYIVALMTQELKLSESDNVLEIGTGSGYQASILAEIVEQVYTIEIIEAMAKRANNSLHDIDYENIYVKRADGYFGWEEHAPYDAIIITAAANHVPLPLIEQLKNNGRLIMPLSSPAGFQALTLITKKDNQLETRFITGVRFVPMTGEAQKKK